MPDDHELLDLVQPGLLEHVRAHHQVRVPVAAGVGAVRADPADLGGEVEDELRARVLEEACRRVHRRQVVVAPARREHLVAVGLEPLDEPRAEEAAAAGDERPHASEPGAVGDVRLGQDAVEAAAARSRRGAFARRASGIGTGPTRFGRIACAPGSIVTAPAFAARPVLGSSRSTSAARPELHEVRRTEALAASGGAADSSGCARSGRRRRRRSGRPASACARSRATAPADEALAHVQEDGARDRQVDAVVLERERVGRDADRVERGSRGGRELLAVLDEPLAASSRRCRRRSRSTRSRRARGRGRAGSARSPRRSRAPSRTSALAGIAPRPARSFPSASRSRA